MSDRELGILITARQAVEQAFQKTQDAMKGVDETAQQVNSTAEKQTNILKLLEGQAGSTGQAMSSASSLEMAALIGVTGASAILLKKTIDYAGSLEALHEQTQISTTDLQTLGAAAEINGKTLDTVASMVNTLQRHLVEGSPRAKAAIGDLGLSLDKLRDQGPYEQLKSVARAITDIPDPARRTADAIALLGGNGAENLGLLKDVADDVGASVFKMSEDTVADVDKIRKAFGALWVDIKSIPAGLLELEHDFVKNGADSIVKGLEGLVTFSADRLAHSASAAIAKALFIDPDAIKDFVPSSVKDSLLHGLAEPITYTKGQVKDLNKELDAGVDALNKQQKAIDELAAAHVPLSAAQQEQIRANLAIGQSQSTIAEAMGVHISQVHALVKADKESEDATKANQKATENYQHVLEDFAHDTAATIRKTLKEIDDKELDTARARAEGVVEYWTLSKDVSRKVSDIHKTETDLRLEQIGDEQQAFEQKVDAIVGKSNEEKEALKRNADEYYDHLRDLATGSADTIVERMRQQGVLTRAEQDQTTARLKADYEQMVASGQFAADELEAAWKRWHDAANAQNDAVLSHTVGMFTELDHAFGTSIGSWAGRAVASFQSIESGFHNLATTGKLSFSSIMGSATSVLNILGSIMSLVPGERIEVTTQRGLISQLHDLGGYSQADFKEAMKTFGSALGGNSGILGISQQQQSQANQYLQALLETLMPNPSDFATLYVKLIQSGINPGLVSGHDVRKPDNSGWYTDDETLEYFKTLLHQHNVPGFAAGGFVDAPTSGMQAMVHGKEVITPLDRFLDLVGVGAGGRHADGDVTQEIHVYLDSDRIATATVKRMPKILRLHGVPAI